jgi:hypothetical protein
VAEGFFIAGTIPFALLGSTHLALTLRDVRRPRYFKPTDDALIPALEASGVAVMAPAAEAQTMWRAWLGANLTHGLGLLVFALLLLAVAVHDSALVSDIPGIRALSITVALAYVLIALRFWFLPAAATAGRRAHLLRHCRDRVDGSARRQTRPYDRSLRVHAAFEFRIWARCDRAVRVRSRIRATSGRLLRGTRPPRTRTKRPAHLRADTSFPIGRKKPTAERWSFRLSSL